MPSDHGGAKRLVEPNGTTEPGGLLGLKEFAGPEDISGLSPQEKASRTRRKQLLQLVKEAGFYADGEGSPFDDERVKMGVKGANVFPWRKHNPGEPRTRERPFRMNDYEMALLQWVAGTYGTSVQEVLITLACAAALKLAHGLEEG